MNKLLVAALAATMSALPGSARAASFLFHAEFTYGVGAESAGDTYAANGTLKADEVAPGSFVVTGATGKVTTSYDRTYGIVRANTTWSGAPSSFTLGSDGAVTAANISFGLDDGFYGILVDREGALGGFGEVGGPLTGLSLTPTAVAPVPEPGSWALMVLGFGLAGAALRRRRARPATPAALA